MRKSRKQLGALVLGSVMMIGAAANAQEVSNPGLNAGSPPPSPRTTGMGPIVYVESQGLYYDSIVLANLPMEGPFQELVTDGPSPTGLSTEFGPGDIGYVGGRWWVDANADGVMNDGDAFFMCPLLGPGRAAP